MTNRNVQHPNRYMIIHADGRSELVELIPSPGEIFDEGTPLVKGTLLSDPTAAALDLSGDPTVDDALNKTASDIATLRSSLAGVEDFANTVSRNYVLSDFYQYITGVHPILCAFPESDILQVKLKFHSNE